MSRYHASQSSPVAVDSKIGSNIAEEFALNPEKRLELIETIPNGSAECYLYRLRQMSLDLQDPSKELTAERMSEALAFLKLAEHSTFFKNNKEMIDQFKAQFALLGYKVQPDLLLKQLSFNKDSVTQLDFQIDPRSSSSSSSSTTTAPSGLDDIRKSLSNTMDQTMISTDVLVKQLLAKIVEKPRDTRVNQDAWPFLMARPETESALLGLSPEDLLSVFKTIQLSISTKSLEMIGNFSDGDRAQVDEIVTKVILRLVETRKMNFGDALSQFQYLTNAQLERLKRADPNLMNDEGFVGLLEKRIFPRPSIDFEEKEAAEVHKEWLDQMLVFVDQLSPKYNRHKLSVYLMSLEYDLKKRRMDKEKFMR